MANTRQSKQGKSSSGSQNGRRSSSSRGSSSMKNLFSGSTGGRKTGFPWKTVLGTTAVAGATAWYLLKNKGSVGEFVRDHLESEDNERTSKRHYNDYDKDDYSETYSSAY